MLTLEDRDAPQGRGPIFLGVLSDPQSPRFAPQEACFGSYHLEHRELEDLGWEPGKKNKNLLPASLLRFLEGRFGICTTSSAARQGVWGEL